MFQTEHIEDFDEAKQTLIKRAAAIFSAAWIPYDERSNSGLTAEQVCLFRTFACKSEDCRELSNIRLERSF